MNFELEIYHEVEDIYNDNIDFLIKLSDGREFTGTFFTLKNIEYLMEKNNFANGEWAGGKYFWSLSMVIVKQLTLEVMKSAIDDLIEHSLVEAALTKCESNNR